MTYRESPDAPEYRLIVEKTLRTTSGPLTTEIALAPVTTMSGCKRLYTKEATQMRNHNIRSVSQGREPYYLALSGRIEVATWATLDQLPDRTDLL